MKNNFKDDFPIFKNDSLVYLDSAATTQKPKSVLDSIDKYYKSQNANPHRGAYKLSVVATEELNKSRQEVANFIEAQNENEIIFTKNATEAFNLLAYSYGLNNLKKDDEVVLSIMEHHSNLVPWQKVAKLKDAKLKYLYINENFEIPDEELEKISPKTKIVSVTLVSNVLGTVNSIEKIIKKAHEVGAIAIIDISQSVAHMPFSVKESDVDFAVFSGHKMYGPMGIGVLYGKQAILNKMSPFLMGGDMIEYVYEQETTFAPLPNKFEAGTQNVAGAVGLASAIKYIKKIGFENIRKLEEDLIIYAREKLKKLGFVELYVPRDEKKHAGVISFNIKGLHPHDVSTFLDYYGICTRSGNHCAQPLLRFLGLDSTVRISFGIYNTREDVDKLINALEKTYDKLKKYIK